MKSLGGRIGEIATLIAAARSILKRLETASISLHTVQNIRDPMSTIYQMLVTFEKILERPKGISHDDYETLIKSWVSAVSKAVYEASDLVDEVVANSAAAAASSLVSKLCRHSLLSCSSCGSIFGVTMGAKITGLRNKLTQLCETTINTSQFDFDMQQETLVTKPDHRFTIPHSNMTTVVGRDKKKEEIVEYLLDTSDPSLRISVVSIVGKGGIGKTTFAMLVYNDERIRNHFDLKLWVCVGGFFNLEKILTDIMQRCTSTSSIGDLALEDQFRATINGILFCLVLDDVWEESHDNWFSLEKLLNEGARGSKILLTTRSGTVATLFDTWIPIHLGQLSDADSWVLFRNIAFDQQEEEPTEDIILLQKKIISQCKGVPLAVLAFANVLHGTSLAKWKDIIDQFYQRMLTPPEPSILDYLELSYRFLASPLKSCFALCSVLPTGFKISFSDLVSLWLAHGYIESLHHAFDDIEETAEMYLMHFYRRGLFTGFRWDEYGKLVTFQMHDLVHDLARHVATGWGTMIHMYIHEKDKKLLRRTSMTDDHKLQSFLCSTAPDGEMIGINDIVEMSNFKSLRVLDLHAFSIEVLPDSIGNLIHLRYLDLSHNECLQKLPKSITNLHHLQTLKLDSCYELKELPTSFGKLVHLRRLELDGCENLTFMPPGFENLTSLRALSRYVVTGPRFHRASGLKSLRNLNHLRGRLIIELSQNWATAVDEAAKSNLINKTNLTELRIKWEPTRHTGEGDDTKRQKLLLDGLQPPSGLKGLQIEGYRGNDFPKWARGNELATALPNLVTVSIDGCGQCETLPPFSRLPFLKRLSLQFMHNVQFFENSDESSSTPALQFFPSLQELTLHSFYSLEGWWKEEAQTQSVSFKCLRKLKLWSCPKLKSMPLFPKIEVLDMQNINEKLLEFHNAQPTSSELQTSTLPSSSSSSEPEISYSEPRQLTEYLHLKILHIKGCPRLKTLVFMKSSKRLKKLVVEKLDMLSSFASLTEALKQLSHLEQLEIASCKDLDLSGGCQIRCGGCEECHVPWEDLSKLQHLTLRELPKLVTLPVGLTFTKKLRTLCISTCSSFNALPECVRDLTSLQHLRLEGCPKLTTLPEELKDIHSLVKIVIIECPQLMEQCRDGGADWHKIKHARVLCHKSWRYALMSDAGISQKPRNHGGNVVVCSEDPNIHVDVTIKRKYDS